MKDNSFVSSVKGMGFEDMGGGEFLRFEGNGIVFAMDIDEDEDACIDGIRLLECYGQECHEREIAYERYINDENDLIVFLKAHDAPFKREGKESEEVARKLQSDLYKEIKHRENIEYLYDELSKRVSMDVLKEHLAAVNKQ